MGLTPKQEKFIKAFRSGDYDYFCTAGTTGSGKSFVDLGLLDVLCANIPNTKFAVIRKSEKNLKQTSIPSYRKMKRITRSERESVISDMTATYFNGSEILFVWADITKDPELDNIKGLEITGALIEEANQIDKKYFDLLKTRIVRHGNDRCNPFIVINLNPSQGWVKELFYDNYVNHTLPERHFFIEFDEDDIKLEDKATTDKFKQLISDLPEEEYSRYVKNNWDYGEVPNQLIKYEWYKNCCIDEYLIKKTDRGMLALDPAGDGSDPSVMARMHGNHIGWWEEDKKIDSGAAGLLARERALEYHIHNADVLVDGIGEGSGAITSMRMKKFVPTIFKASNSADYMNGLLSCLNARAESHWILREAFRNEEITVTHHPRFQKECTKTTYDVTDRCIKIAPKEILKKAKYIGWSPGMLDCASMLAWRHYTTGGSLRADIIKKQNSQFMQKQLMGRAEIDRHRRITNSLVGV